MIKLCKISGLEINGSVNTTYSKDNSTNNGQYNSSSKGVYNYHKTVENFRSNNNIKVKDLKPFTQDYLNGLLSEFDVISFRGIHKVSMESMKSYTDFLDSKK